MREGETLETFSLKQIEHWSEWAMAVCNIQAGEGDRYHRPADCGRKQKPFHDVHVKLRGRFGAVNRQMCFVKMYGAHGLAIEQPRPGKRSGGHGAIPTAKQSTPTSIALLNHRWRPGTSMPVAYIV